LSLATPLRDPRKKLDGKDDFYNGANSITYEIISSPPERILDTSLLGSSKTGNVKALTRPYANLALTVTPALEFGFAFEPGLMSQIVPELGVLRGHT
jgi:hypothetical protein